MFEEIPNDWTCPACGDGNVHPRQHLAFLLASLTSFERFILLIVRNFLRKESFIMFDHYLQSNPEAKQEDIAKHIGKSLSTVKRITPSLIERGLLQRENGKRNGKWIVKI